MPTDPAWVAPPIHWGLPAPTQQLQEPTCDACSRLTPTSPPRRIAHRNDGYPRRHRRGDPIRAIGGGADSSVPPQPDADQAAHRQCTAVRSAGRGASAIPAVSKTVAGRVGGRQPGSTGSLESGDEPAPPVAVRTPRSGRPCLSEWQGSATARFGTSGCPSCCAIAMGASRALWWQVSVGSGRLRGPGVVPSGAAPRMRSGIGPNGGAIHRRCRRSRPATYRSVS
jgi:hypothetical protein